jgi:dipeptide/tripeptide permease
MHASTVPAVSPSSDFLGHPKGVYVCFFTEMWERFSFYGMKALLLLYLTKYHLFGDKAGLDLLGAYGGLVYCARRWCSAASCWCWATWAWPSKATPRTASAAK